MFGASIFGAVEFAQDSDSVYTHAGTAAGTSTAAAVSATIAVSIASGAGLAEGTSAFIVFIGGPVQLRPYGVGTAVIGAAGSSAGVGAASAAGTVVRGAAGSAAGAASATATSAATAASVGLSSGTGAAAAVGRGIHEAAGSAAGTSTAAAVNASFVAGAGAAAGTASASAVGQGSDAAVGASSGASSAIAVATARHDAAGSAAGSSTAAATALESHGQASGSASASSIGRAIYSGLAMAAGVALAVAVGTRVVGAAGHAAGTSQGRTVALSHGTAEGHGRATAVSRNSSVNWGNMLFTADGIPIKTQNGHLIEGLNNTPSTLTFTVFAAGTVAMGNEIIVAYGDHGEQRYFTGRVIRIQTVRNVDDAVRYQITAVDKSWIMAQNSFSGFYQGAGGYAGDRRLRFQNTSEADALTKLTAMDGKSWRVDAYGNVITFVYDTTASPEQIDLDNESMQNVAVEESVEQHINRVYAAGFGASSIERSGNFLAFPRNAPDMSGRVLINSTFRGSMTQAPVVPDSFLNLHYDISGSGSCVDGVFLITATFVTNYGESAGSPTSLDGNSSDILVAGHKLVITPNYPSLVAEKAFDGLFGQIQQINLYIQQWDTLAARWYQGFLGSLPVDGTGSLVYDAPASSLDGRVPPAFDQGAEISVGVLTMDDGLLIDAAPDETQQVNVAVEEVVNDTAAQATFAGLFGGDGVLTGEISDGSWSRADCIQAAQAELDKYIGPLKYLLSYTSRDPEVHPGRLVRVTGYPALHGADYVIGQNSIVLERTTPPMPPLVTVSNAGVFKPQGHALFENRFRTTKVGSTGALPTVFPPSGGAGTTPTSVVVSGAGSSAGAADAAGVSPSPGGTFRLKLTSWTAHSNGIHALHSLIGGASDETDATAVGGDGKAIRFDITNDSGDMYFNAETDGVSVYLNGSSTPTLISSLPGGFAMTSFSYHVKIAAFAHAGAGGNPPRYAHFTLYDGYYASPFDMLSANDGFYDGWAEGWVNKGDSHISGEGTDEYIYTYDPTQLANANAILATFLASQNSFPELRQGHGDNPFTAELDLDSIWFEGTYTS